MIVLTISVVLLMGVVAYLMVEFRRMSLAHNRMSMILENLSSYAFLIDRNFEVKESNYYLQNPSQTKEEPQVLGNVLRCSTACESGTCGTGLSCKHCPVRFVINKSFERKNDFNDLEVSMELYDQNRIPTDVDVNVGGRYVQVDGQPHMVLNIKDVSESKRLLRNYIDGSLAEESDPKVPKVLFASHDVARYNRLRVMLKDTCRLVYVEKTEQVLHRVGKSKDYGYAAVLFDEAFLHENNLIDNLNEHIVVIRMTENGDSGIDGRFLNIPHDIADHELSGILARCFL